MFCPKCGCEYREGFSRCSDCDTKLVKKLKKRKGNNIAYLDDTIERDKETSLFKFFYDGCHWRLLVKITYYLLFAFGFVIFGELYESGK